MGKLAKSRYRVLKAQVHQWIAQWEVVAAGLKEIHDERLYLEEYASFDEFCANEYHISRQRAYRLLEGLGVKAMLPNGRHLTNERQVRAIAAVPAEKRVNVLDRAVKSGKVTAKSIEIAAIEDAIESGELVVVDPAPMLEAVGTVGTVGTVVVETETVIFEPAELDRLAGVNEIPTGRNECLGCQAKDNELRTVWAGRADLVSENEQLKERIEELELAVIAAANEGEVPLGEPVAEIELVPYRGGAGVDMDALRQIAAGEMPVPAEVAEAPKNCMCKHCGERFAGSRFASLCGRCRDNGHQERQPEECRECQMGFAA